MWSAGTGGDLSANLRAEARLADAEATLGQAAQMRDLEYQVARQNLLLQAMWELLRERAKLTDAQLEQKAQEIDMRDGVQDGRITDSPLRCPSCGRVSNSRHWRCLYCGQQFEKPVMG